MPWQRVLNSRGEISMARMSQGAAVQRALLEAEVVVFDEQGRIDLKVYGWARLDPIEVEELLNTPPPA